MTNGEQPQNGYGLDFSAIVESVRPLAESIVDDVRVNTPDCTGRGIVMITATNIAIAIYKAVAAERERCLKIVQGYFDNLPAMNSREFSLAEIAELEKRIHEGKA